MGRTLSTTGVVFGEHLKSIKDAVAMAELIAIESITNKTVDGEDFAAYMGRILAELMTIRTNYEQLWSIYESNKTTGKYDRSGGDE